MDIFDLPSPGLEIACRQSYKKSSNYSFEEIMAPLPRIFVINTNLFYFHI